MFNPQVLPPDADARIRYLRARIAASTDPTERAVFIDRLVPYFVSRGQPDEAQHYLDLVTARVEDESLALSLAVLVIVVASQRGEEVENLDEIERRVEGERISEEVRARVYQRLSLASYMLQKSEEATKYAQRAVAQAEAIQNWAIANSAAGVLCAVAYYLTGNLETATFWAERWALFAKAANDLPTLRASLAQLYGLAASFGDVERVENLRAVLELNRAADQFGEGSAFAIAEALRAMWRADFSLVRSTMLAQLKTAKTPADHVIYRGFLALSSAALHLDHDAKRYGRQAIAMSRVRDDIVRINERRRRWLGRILAAAARLEVGDIYDARRVLTANSAFGQGVEHALARALARGHVDINSPDLRGVRGYILALNAMQSARSSGNSVKSLSEKEREVLFAVSRGMTNSEIARAFGISTSAVKKRLSGLMDKLGARNRAEAIAKSVNLSD